jgi:hypothetical protein
VHTVTNREAWLSALLVFAVALVVRALAAVLIEFPKPEDTAYYVGVARNLVEGRGAVTDAIWSFHTPPLVFPKPAFEIWLPLPALLAAVPIWLSGAQAPIPLDVAFRAAQPPFILAGAAVAVLAWRLAADVAQERGLPANRARMLALGTGLTAAVYLPLVLHSVLPDSTMVFAAFALAALILMARVLRDPRGGRALDPRTIAIGLCLGLAALCRNEFVFIALVWVWLVWRTPAAALGASPWPARVRLVWTVAAVSLAIYTPWMVRNWIEFGNPLPGQAISNALSITGFDIFAWNDQPTLERYLAVGPAALLEMRVVGTLHNLGNVLLLLGLPVSLIGLAALPWQVRDRALRPLLLFSAITFAVTSLLFPVATTWGTFLHAAGPVHVLLLVSALGALDRAIVWIGARRGWHRPVAWLGPFLAVFASAVFSAALMPTFGSGSVATARTYEALAERMAAIGEPFDASGQTVYIHDFPIWLAETARVRTLALPDETLADVLDLAAAFPGTEWLITSRDDHGDWPAVLDGPDPDAACFEEVDLGTPPDPELAAAMEGVRLFRIGCGPPTVTMRDTPPDSRSP